MATQKLLNRTLAKNANVQVWKIHSVILVLQPQEIQMENSIATLVDLDTLAVSVNRYF